MAARTALGFVTEAASARTVISAVEARSANIPSLIDLLICFSKTRKGPVEKKL